MPPFFIYFVGTGQKQRLSHGEATGQPRLQCSNYASNVLPNVPSKSLIYKECSNVLIVPTFTSATQNFKRQRPPSHSVSIFRPAYYNYQNIQNKQNIIKKQTANPYTYRLLQCSDFSHIPEHCPSNLEQSSPQLNHANLEQYKALPSPRSLEQKLDIVSLLWYTGRSPVGQIIFNTISSTNQEHSYTLLDCSKRKEANHEDMYEMRGISKQGQIRLGLQVLPSLWRYRSPSQKPEQNNRPNQQIQLYAHYRPEPAKAT